MVNARAQTTDAATDAERRERARARTPEPAALGLANPNPFGDLHTIQHLTARLARALKPTFERLYRADCRTWAEPVAVERMADYRSERSDDLAAWLALPAGHEASAQAVFDARLVLELLDLFFGGPGHPPSQLPKEFSPAAMAMVERLGRSLVPALCAAWEPVTSIVFTPGGIEANPAVLRGIESDDAIVVTRIGIAHHEDKPRFLDILYPVATLKPHQESITRKVHVRAPDVPPAWRQSLTRAVMGVRLPVRTVLAEPVMPLAELLGLKVGDVIPIGFGEQVPVMVGDHRLAMGTIGTSSGKAAIQLTTLALTEGPAQ